MARLVQLVRGSQAGWAGPDNGHTFARAFLWRIRLHPSLLPGVVDDGALDVLDGHGGLVDAEDTGALTGGWTDPARELWEVVGLGQLVESLLPVAVEHQVVELGDDVAQGTAVRGGVAERHSAVHTPTITTI